MIEHLTGPYQAGAVESEVAIDSTGKINVAEQTRAPLLLVAPAQRLDRKRLALTASVPGSSTDMKLEFGPYTEAGAFLPLHVPPNQDPSAPMTAPFFVSIKKLEQVDPELEETDPSNASAPVAASQIASRLQVRLVEGILGRVLYLLGAEEQRLRRQGREVAAMRVLSRARLDALDRLGADLGVARFADQYKKGSALFVAAREPDAEYRRRLRLFGSLLLRSRETVLGLLNGGGASTDPNAGPIGDLAPQAPTAGRDAYRGRFGLEEADNDLAVGIHIVAAGDPDYRANFFEFIRAVHLIWPKNNAAANKVHEARFLPTERVERETRLRAALRSLFTFSSFLPGTEPAFAPMLAAALVRAGRCIKALGGPTPLAIYRAQLDNGGSRYELGLGVDVKRLTAAELNAMGREHARLKAADPEFKQVQDPDSSDPSAKAELSGLLKGMSPESSAADPDGRWVLEACGVRTVHRIPKPSGAPWSLTYLSHFPTFGMTVSLEPPVEAVEVGGWTDLIPGDFETRINSNLLAFEQESGAGQVLSFTDNGDLTSHPRVTGWGTDWTQLVVGRFGAIEDWWHDELFSYSRSRGEAQFYGYDREGSGFQPLGPLQTNLTTGWTQVVAGRYAFANGHGIFCYESEASKGTFFVGDGAGGLEEIRSHDGIGRTWSEIVPVVNERGRSDLFFYDRRSGEGALYLVDDEGGLTQSGPTFQGLRRSWTHIVPGHFSGRGDTARRAQWEEDAKEHPRPEHYYHPPENLLFYDAVAGEAEIYDLEMQLLSASKDWPKGWTTIVPGQFGQPVFIDGVGATALALHDRVTGTLEIQRSDGDGGFTLHRRHTGLGKGPKHSIAARYHAPGDPGGHVVLEDGLKGALGDWTAAGNAPWAVLSRTEAERAWNRAIPVNDGDPGAAVLSDAGLPRVEDPAPVANRLQRIPPELLATIRLDDDGAKQILTARTGTEVAAAAELLRTLASGLTSGWLASALPLITDRDEVVVVIGVIPLPMAGTNLFRAPSARFRWYVVPIEGLAGEIRTTGSRTDYAPAVRGLSAVIALGHSRSGLTDPYEYRVELPEDRFLTMKQYEFLMNLLEHTTPVGVQVNTYSIRRDHVDVGETGTASLLDPEISHTYREFRRPHHRGEPSVEARPSTT